jgi:hypothetical protein
MLPVYGACLTGLSVSPYALSAPIPTQAESKAIAQMPAYLTMLLEANTLDDRAIGVAAAKTQTYAAFEQALLARDSIRPEVETILQQGTPAGRIYAALLLSNFDAKAGKSALEQLQSEQIEVTRRSGCEVFVIRVSQVATEILHGELNLYPNTHN